jgi:uncharacterized membrane protein
MRRRLAREDWPLWVLIPGVLAAGLLLLPRLPARVPVHWNLRGQPDGWQSPLTAAVMEPALAAGVYLLLVALPLIDPRRRNYAEFAPTLRIVRWLVVLLILGLHASVLAHAAGLPLAPAAGARAAVAVLLLVLGNSLPRVRPNWFIGIRTPWTLSSDAVWRDTHRFAGPCLVIAGLLCIPLVFVPAAWGGASELALVLAAVLVPAVYSYFRYQR